MSRTRAVCILHSDVYVCACVCVCACVRVHVCVHVGITANINTGPYEFSSETIFHVIYYVKITLIFSCHIIFISTSSQQRARFFWLPTLEFEHHIVTWS